MGLRRRVRSLERAAGHLLEVFTLPDVLAASLRRREHPLLSSVREADTSEGLVGLIRELEASRARVERDEEPSK